MSQKSKDERRWARYAKKPSAEVQRVAQYDAAKKQSKQHRKAYRERLVRNATPGIRNQCGRKVKHKTYAAALLHLTELRGGKGMHVYKCLICTGYHVGHLQTDPARSER